MVKSFRDQKKKEKGNELYKKYTEEQNSVLVYKTFAKTKPEISPGANLQALTIGSSMYEHIL